MLAGKLPTGSVGEPSTDGDRIHGRSTGRDAGARTRRTDGRHGYDADAGTTASRANRPGAAGADATDVGRGGVAGGGDAREDATRARASRDVPRHDSGPRADAGNGSVRRTDAPHAGAAPADAGHAGAPPADHVRATGTDRGRGGGAPEGSRRADSSDRGTTCPTERRRLERRLAAERAERRAVIERYERLLDERTAAVGAARDPPDESGGPTAAARAWFRRTISRIDLSV